MLFTPPHEKLIREISVDVRKLVFNPESVVVVNMNTVNGFFRKGAFSSSRMKGILPAVKKVNEYYLDSPKLFLVDRHTEKSTEFEAYPPHCVDPYEQEIVTELEEFAQVGEIIPKNCTNPFFTPGYLKWIREHKEIENIVLVGGYTDISVMQFALAQKACWNEQNCNNRIIVMENAVQTYHDEIHNGDAMHAFALFNMYMNDIKIAYL